MGHSYLEYGGKNILINDIEIIIVESIILDFFRSGNEVSNLTQNIKNLLIFWQSSEAYGPGTLGFDFDSYISDNEDKLALLQLIDSTKKWIQKKGKIISGEYLNKVTDAAGVLQFSDRQVSDIISMFEKFGSLLSIK